MEVIEWDKSYSVGVRELDEQHKQLFKIVNTLFDIPDTGMDSQNVSDLLASMKKYAAVHFATEEKYLSECAYPDIENHILVHRQFREKIEDLCQRGIVNHAELFGDILSFLYEWLLDHILSCDKKYAPFLNSYRDDDQLPDSSLRPLQRF
jgi:hemerythrin-like metal-binding protein